MTVVRSPRLERCTRVLVSTARKKDWFCYNLLNELIEIPDAKFYWLEASTRQWKDKSGKRVLCQISKEIFFKDYAGYFRRRGSWSLLYGSTIRPLKRLGLCPGGKPKAIFIRLLYQE